MKQVVTAVDIGGTNTVLAILDRTGRILSRRSFKTGMAGDFEEYMVILAKEIKALFSENKDWQAAGIGVGAPDANYNQGTIEMATNLSWPDKAPFVQKLQELTGIPVALTNDANASAYGEQLYGGAQGMRDFVEITLGTGLGSGIVCNGKMVHGHSGFAGELGHLQLVPGGRQCGCGRRGCVEAYVSATGMVRTALEVLADFSGSGSSLLSRENPADLDSLKIYKAAEMGDPLAIEVFDRTADYLARLLADVCVFTSPEAIFLFGGPVQAGEMLLQPLRQYFDQYCMPVFKDKVSIRISALPAGTAALLGAGALIWETLEEKNFLA